MGDFNPDLLNGIFSLDDNNCNSLNMDSSIFQTSVISLPIRHNKDQKVYNYGHRLIELCKKSNLCIVNGRVRDQSSENFICKDASVVDYFLVSLSLVFNIVDFQVLDTDLLFSDYHSSLSMYLQINKCKNDANCFFEQDTVSIENDLKLTGTCNSKVIWRKDSKMSFIENLDIGREQELCGKMDLMSTDMNINQLVDDCNSILLNAAC